MYPIYNRNMLNTVQNFQAPNKNVGFARNIILIVLLVGVVGGIGLFLYSRSGGTSSFLNPRAGGDSKDPNAGKIEAKLTGVLYSKEEAEKFNKIRPLAVMVNNHLDARPQSGLQDADLVYEIVAEGGITRFLAFFNTKIPEKIGPVRSTREYYLVLVRELGDAMLMHIGWSPQALVAIESWPVKSLGRGNAPFWRDQGRLDAGVAYEHTAYTNGKELIKKGEELGWQGTNEDFVSYKFKADSPVKPGDTVDKASKITVDFWYPGDYSAYWEYDPVANVYNRFMGYDASDKPIIHADGDSGKQIKVKNLIVQTAKEISIPGDDKNRLDYELVGSGEALVFIDGKVYKVTWSKESRDARTLFYTLDGEEIKFNRGNFWISIVPDRNTEQVVYE